MTAADTPTAPSSMCRDGRHVRCSELKARCACTCHGAPQMPPTTAQNRKTATVSQLPIGAQPKPLHSATDDAAGPPPQSKDADATFRLIKKDPPAGRVKSSIADRVLPLLDEIPAEDSGWWSAVAFSGPDKSKRANSTATACRKKIGPGWQWKSAGGEVFVRRERADG